MGDRHLSHLGLPRAVGGGRGNAERQAKTGVPSRKPAFAASVRIDLMAIQSTCPPEIEPHPPGGFRPVPSRLMSRLLTRIVIKIGTCPDLVSLRDRMRRNQAQKASDYPRVRP